MKNTPNIYDFILKSFVSTDDYISNLQTPGYIDDTLYATDAHVCIRFDKKYANLDYSKNKDYPEANKVYETTQNETTTILNTEKLLESVFHCQTIYETKQDPCKKCKGAGYIHCKCCDNNNECKKCEGNGFKEKTIPYAKPTLHGDDIVLFDKVIQPKFIYKVIQVAMLLKKETIEVIHHETSSKIYFIIGPCEILIMSKITANPQ